LSAERASSATPNAAFHQVIPLTALASKDSPMNQTSKRPAVFAKFVNKEILGEWGRLLFSLLDTFALSGYEISLFDSIPHQALGKYGPLIFSLQHFTMTDAEPTDTADAIYLFDREDKAIGKRPWRKKVQVKFDVFSPYWFSDPIIMPYPVHPVQTGPDLSPRLQEHRRQARKMRIFFSGDTEGYVKNRIHYPTDKLPRLDVINAISEGIGNQLSLVKDEASLASLLGTDRYVNKFVLIESGGVRIEAKHWLGTLASSDFFLCPPGYIMPMCHNTVEALAVGAIPIINYPEWFTPRLEHLKNCIVFNDKSDLIDKLSSVLMMGDEQIAVMRQRAIDYYDNFLTPSSFTRRIEATKRQKIIVLMITDANVLRNASRLSRRSILIRSGRPSSRA
jgi:hypothetical protein